MHELSPAAVAALRDMVAGGTWSYRLSDGEVGIILAPLPGRAVVGAAQVADTLWVVIDIEKPDARGHLLQLIDHWPLGEVAGEHGHALTLDDVLTLLAPFEPDGSAPVVLRG